MLPVADPFGFRCARPRDRVRTAAGRRSEVIVHAHQSVHGGTRQALSPRGPEPAAAVAISLASRSATITVGMCVLAEGTSGIIDASATNSPSTPWTHPCASTTEARSDAGPIAQVPVAWWYVQRFRRTQSRRSRRLRGGRSRSAWRVPHRARTAGWAASASARSRPSTRRSTSVCSLRWPGSMRGGSEGAGDRSLTVPRERGFSSAAPHTNVDGPSSDGS
jgi:hypothetical protein